MSLQSFVWRIYCVTEGQFVATVSDTEPTLCPNNPAHTIDPSFTSIVATNFLNLMTDSYINIQSTLADNQCIKINASDTNGGINITAGQGGINVATTNSIQLNGGAQCNFSTSDGNLILDASAGLLDIDGYAGINIGNSGTSGPIFIGTTGTQQAISIGNNSGGTYVNVDAGTGGINLNTTGGGAISLNADGMASNFTLNSSAPNQDLTISTVGATSSRIVLSSQGTGADSIIFETSNGGLVASVVGNLSLASSSSSGSAIALSTTNGGINISAGNGGIIIDCPGFRSMNIGTSNASEYIQVGNNGGSSYLGLRAGTSGIIKTQQTETTLADSDATLTASELLTNIFVITPTVTRTLTLDTSPNIVAGLYSAQISDSFDFSIINEASSVNVNVVAGATGTLIGSGTVNGTSSNSGSALFRVRLTNVTSGSQTYNVYRIA